MSSSDIRPLLWLIHKFNNRMEYKFEQTHELAERLYMEFKTPQLEEPIRHLIFSARSHGKKGFTEEEEHKYQTTKLKRHAITQEIFYFKLISFQQLLDAYGNRENKDVLDKKLQIIFGEEYIREIMKHSWFAILSIYQGNKKEFFVDTKVLIDNVMTVQKDLLNDETLGLEDRKCLDRLVERNSKRIWTEEDAFVEYESIDKRIRPKSKYPDGFTYPDRILARAADPTFDSRLIQNLQLTKKGHYKRSIFLTNQDSYSDLSRKLDAWIESLPN